MMVLQKIFRMKNRILLKPLLLEKVSRVSHSCAQFKKTLLPLPTFPLHPSTVSDNLHAGSASLTTAVLPTFWPKAWTPHNPLPALLPCTLLSLQPRTSDPLCPCNTTQNHCLVVRAVSLHIYSHNLPYSFSKSVLLEVINLSRQRQNSVCIPFSKAASGIIIRCWNLK